MIEITPQAAKRISNHLVKRGKGIGVRVGVRTTGCSGMAYVLEYVDQVNVEDNVFNTNEVSVIVDPKSLLYLKGMTIDYARNGLNEGFEFKNPNERDRCGCGESFRPV
jgi:iron-sulfur cluster assembly protein